MSEDPVDRWRPLVWTPAITPRPAGSPPVERWEAVLEAEGTPAFKLATVIAAVPAVRRLLRVPAWLAAAPAGSLADREADVEAVAASRLGRFLRPVPDGVPRNDARIARLEDAPSIGRLHSREIDNALEVLADVPFEELQARGWHVQPNHFYWPLNDLDFLRRNPELWTGQKVPLGIDWDLDGQERLLHDLAAYAPELDDVRDSDAAPGEYVWNNGAMPRLDALAYYGLIRSLRPRRVVEVGSGWSTILLRRALEANADGARATLVEPFPRPEVFGELPEDWRILRHLVQHAGLECFEELEAGDVVFYDGSHCVRTGSDVNWMVFEVFPRLAPGVWIHVHDMFWPNDYLASFVLDEGLSWNEQYLMQAFLMDNGHYRVRLANGMLMALRPGLASRLAGNQPTGGSLWIEKVARGVDE